MLDETDGRHQQGEPVSSGATVTQAVGELEAGSYRISYRVGSADGHPVTGTLTFTVAAPAAATTQPEPTATTPRSPGTASNSAADVDHSEHTTTPSAVAGGLRGEHHACSLPRRIVGAPCLGRPLRPAGRPGRTDRERGGDTGHDDRPTSVRTVRARCAAMGVAARHIPGGSAVALCLVRRGSARVPGCLRRRNDPWFRLGETR